MKYFAPISIGNFSVGFDLLGLSLTAKNGELIGDIVTIERSEQFEFSCSGKYAKDLPDDSEQNLVIQAYDLFKDKMLILSKEIKEVKIHLDKRLPVGSGLGSSASSIVATLYGLNDFFEEPLSVDEILLMSGKLEGCVSGSIHYDNVAPSLLGGLQLMTPNSLEPSVTLPFPENWQLVVSYPGIEVSTKAAREILPIKLDISRGIKFAQNLSVFVHALHINDDELAASVLFDVIAEESRKKLIPGFTQYRDFAKSMGALAFGISGSGSTVFSVCQSTEVADKVQSYAIKNFCNENGFSHICRMDPYGVRPISEESKNVIK